MEYQTLSNGIKMPTLGFGTYKLYDEECEKCVLEALNIGYRSIDTAQFYDNEEAVGNALQKTAISRDEIFLTTKIWVSDAGYEKAKASIIESLQRLQTDYIDLMLVHQPFSDYYGTWRALEEAYKAGKIKAIGVSNFSVDQLIDLAHFNEVAPMINQLETHVFQQQKLIRPYLEKYHTCLTAWSPFARGENNLFSNPVLVKIGKKHAKSTGQVTLRFLTQSGISIIPKSSSKERMKENFDIFDFTLTNTEIKEIEALDTATNFFLNHQNPVDLESFLAKFEL